MRNSSVLGCQVTSGQRALWQQLLAPERQPFIVDDALSGLVGEDDELPEMDDLDTFLLYGKRRLRWLTEDEFMGLDRKTRAALVRHQHRERRGVVPSVRSAPVEVRDLAREQADGHRFVWWPSLLAPVAHEVVDEFISRGWSDSRQTEIDWSLVPERLQSAHELGSTFADHSGANCFSTVMAGAGVSGVADTWVMGEPFEDWLSEATEPGGRDDQPGTVLVWREKGEVSHAAITLGGGWALNKPSQAWYTPRFIWTTATTLRTSQFVGGRLERRRLR